MEKAILSQVISFVHNIITSSVYELNIMLNAWNTLDENHLDWKICPNIRWVLRSTCSGIILFNIL